MTHIVKSGSMVALALALVAGMMPGAAWAQIAPDVAGAGQPVFQTVAEQRDGRRGGGEGRQAGRNRASDSRAARSGGGAVTGTSTWAGRQRGTGAVPTTPQVRQRRGGADPSLGRDSGAFGLSNVRRSGDRRQDARTYAGRPVIQQPGERGDDRYRRGDRNDYRTDRTRRTYGRNQAYRSGYANGAAADTRGDRRDQRQAYAQGYRQGVRSDDYYGRARQRYASPGYNNRYNGGYGAGALGNARAWDNRGWRNDRRYDWAGYRARNRSLYSPGRYYAPYSNYRYNRVGIGFSLGAAFFSSRYLINDPFTYRLPPVYGPYRWVRYYDDVLLVNTYTGDVVDVIHDFFY